MNGAVDYYPRNPTLASALQKLHEDARKKSIEIGTHGRVIAEFPVTGSDGITRVFGTTYQNGVQGNTRETGGTGMHLHVQMNYGVQQLPSR